MDPDYVCLDEHRARCAAAALMTLAGLERGQEERVVAALSRGLGRGWLGVSGSHRGRRWSGKLLAQGGAPRLAVVLGADGSFVAAANAKLTSICADAQDGSRLVPPAPRSRLSGLAAVPRAVPRGFTCPLMRYKQIAV